MLTHLGDPRSALKSFAELAMPSARLLVQETEVLESDHLVLARYYACVSAMQAAHGQQTKIGVELEAACQGSTFRVEHSRVRMLAQDAGKMARLHRMNLATWRTEPRAAALFDQALLDGLDQGLARIESGADAAPPVRNGLRELVLRRL